MFRSGKANSVALNVTGRTGKTADPGLPGPLDAVAGSSGVRESPEDLETDIFRSIRGRMTRAGPVDGGSP